MSELGLVFAVAGVVSLLIICFAVRRLRAEVREMALYQMEIRLNVVELTAMLKEINQGGQV